jgi:hypothetical protein
MNTKDKTRDEILRKMLHIPEPPSIEEVLASPDNPRLWLDPEFEEVLDKAIADVGWPRKLGCQQWKNHLAIHYRKHLHEYYMKGAVIPFVEATDEHLQDLLGKAQSHYDDEVKTLHGEITTTEHLQEFWRRANEEAKRIRCYTKTERQDGRNSYFKEFLSRELQWIKEWVFEKAHPPPPPPPPRIEIDLPPEWFAEETEGLPAKTIEETKRLLAPNVHHALEKFFPDDIRVTDDYVYVADEKWGFKVSRTLGCVWLAHHGHWNPVAGDLLNLFKELFQIDDDRKAWKKLDALRRQIEQEDPEIRAQKAREREKRKLEAEKEFLFQIKKTISEFTEKAGMMTPPPAGHKKRANKTSRAFWEWIFPLDGPVTAAHVKAAFEYWEQTKDDRYFRVVSKVYSGKINWSLVKTAVPNKVIQRNLTLEEPSATQKLIAKEEADQLKKNGFEKPSLICWIASRAKK